VSPTSPRGDGRDPGPDDSSHEGWPRRERSGIRRPRRDEQGADPDPYGWGAYSPPEPRRAPRTGRRGPDHPPTGNGRPPSAPPVPPPTTPPVGPPDAGLPRPDLTRPDLTRPDLTRPDLGGPDVNRPDLGRPDLTRPDTTDPGRRRAVPAGGSPAPASGPPAGPPAGNRTGIGRSRLRGPHKRRAVAGQQTGLDPELQPDLPSWLQERGVALAPVRRLLSLSVALFAALLGFGLLAGALTLPRSYAFVIFGVQLFFVLAWTVAMRPPGPWVVAVVGLAAAAGADLAAVLPKDASLAPLGYVTVAGFVFGVLGQLLRGAGRQGVTESLGATVAVVVGVVAFASLLVLDRRPLGTRSIVACLSAAAVALVVARLADVVLPVPRTSPEVPRGTIGVVLGAMAGTAAAATVGALMAGLTPGRTAIAGVATAMVAIMADLAVSYSEAGRELSGEPSPLWIARHMQGPLGGYALAAPAAYILSVMVLVPGF
jgi:hypothetical protein